jgi:hypothetical protein
MKTGDILELAEVVRNLSLRDREKGLSTGEKQMFVKAKKILASELMYAKDMDEEEAAEWLDGVLVGASANGSAATTATNGRKKPAAAAKPAKVAAKTAAKPAARKTAAAKPAARKTAAKTTAAKSKPKTKARAASK